jgi:uncharacterized protein (TIGR04255 family)
VPKHKRPSGLPGFSRPPIDEVVLSIQFAPPENFTTAHMGLFWRSIRSKYPTVTQQPKLPPLFETFGTPPISGSAVQFQAMMAPPMPRFWFDNENGPDLLQLQQDRIIHNWRKREQEQIYPRYGAIRSRFESEVQAFVEFLEKEQLGELRVNQCEVSYINVIQLPDNVDPHLKITEISPLWSTQITESASGKFENSSLYAQYLLSDNQKPFGRIYVNFQPAFRPSDLSPLIRLEITARGTPNGESISEAFRLLDEERSAIVRTFADVTTPMMHEIWGRTDASQ